MTHAGTPGRVKHMISKGALDTSHIKILVLDEVDTMLSRGFEEQVTDHHLYTLYRRTLSKHLCAWGFTALLKMGRYYNTTMCHYWDMLVK